jgi:hypothetical protein
MSFVELPSPGGGLGEVLSILQRAERARSSRNLAVVLAALLGLSTLLVNLVAVPFPARFAALTMHVGVVGYAIFAIVRAAIVSREERRVLRRAGGS